MSSSKRVVVAFHIPEALRDVLGGVTRYAREARRDWQILCVNADEFAANFNGHRCHGAIVMVRPEATAAVRQLSRSRTPVVNLLRDLTPALPSVLSDDPAIGRAGALYLRGLGFKKLAFISLDTSWSRQRQAGFVAGAVEAGLAPPATTESLGVRDFRVISQVQSIKTLGKWARSLGPRTAIMTPSDFVARTLLNACQDAALEVPKDVAILGVDNFPNLCELWPVPISSIAQDFSRMGFEAAKLLDEQMKQRKRFDSPLLIPPGRIHVRASTNVLAFDDPLVAEAMGIIQELGGASSTMRELLRRVPLSRRWLDERFKQAVGHTPAEEVRRARLRAARDLLTDTDLPLRLIASRCRFSFPENLIRAFRKTYGVSPNQYRQKHRNVRA